MAVRKELEEIEQRLNFADQMRFGDTSKRAD